MAKQTTPAVAKPAATSTPETAPVAAQVQGNEPAAAVVAPAETPAAPAVAEAPAAETAPADRTEEATIDVNGLQYTKDKETGALVGMSQDSGASPRLTPSEFVTDPIRDTTKATPRVETKTQGGSIRRDY